MPPGSQAYIVYDSGLLRIDVNTDLLAVAVRDVGPGSSLSPVQVLVFASTGSANFARDSRAGLRVVHSSPNQPPLDFLKAPDAANDPACNRIATALAFPDETCYLPFAEGTYDLSAALVNTATGIINVDDLVLSRGGSNTLFVAGLHIRRK